MRGSIRYKELKEEFIKTIKEVDVNCRIKSTIIPQNVIYVEFTYRGCSIQSEFWEFDKPNVPHYYLICHYKDNEYHTPKYDYEVIREEVFQKIDKVLKKVITLSRILPDIYRIRKTLVDKLFNGDCNYYPSTDLSTIDIWESSAPLELLSIYKGTDDYTVKVDLIYPSLVDCSAKLIYDVFTREDCSSYYKCQGEISDVTSCSLDEKIEELQIELYRHIMTQTKCCRLISMSDLFYAKKK